MTTLHRAAATTVLSLLVFSDQSAGTSYYVGVGIHDVTGPAADVNMMGYANPGQTTHGIHVRQFSRAFVFSTSLKGPRIVFINLEAAWAGGAVKREVVKRLQVRYANKSMYTVQNICISGTHTHSGVGGYSQYLLFDITAFGFNRQSYEALVVGIFQSIVEAHANMKPADIYVNSGELLDSNINRSPTAYLANPIGERKKYKYNVDKDMVVLKIVGGDGKDMGMISWFAVHCTSMNNTNRKISSDNKGYASQMFEKHFSPQALPGQGAFVAAFAQSNEGDVSPNTRGPHCLDTGLPCDIPHSTCNGWNELCVSSGPGKDMLESTKIIGTNQLKRAMDLYASATIKLSGPVEVRHSYADMTNQVVTLSNGMKAKTCKPSMGYSFAAGTTDGPGAFDFTQGTNTSNPFWNLIRDLIKKPSKELMDCHHPKPILLATGEITKPYLWQPEIVDTQLLRIGELVLIAVPGEFSTMSGRRLREAVHSALVQGGIPSNTTTVIAGLSNEYSDYITTYEEYQVQRYEGGSTVYGPHTLSAYIQLYKKLAIDLATGRPSPSGPSPPNLMEQQLSLLPGVIYDSTPLWRNFGDVLANVNLNYTQNSTVHVRFQSADPRNNLRTNDSYLLVEREAGADKWVVEYTDSCWETRFEWIRTSTILGWSEALVTWQIPLSQTPGNYRIRHFGTSKALFTSELTDFSGTSKTFIVTGAKHPRFIEFKIHNL